MTEKATPTLDASKSDETKDSELSLNKEKAAKEKAEKEKKEKADKTKVKKKVSFSQIDLGKLPSRPKIQPKLKGYYFGVTPFFKWRGSIDVPGGSFQIQTRLKEHDPFTPEEEKDEFEEKRDVWYYGIQTKQTEEWAERLLNEVLKRGFTLNDGKIRYMEFSKPCTEEDPALNLTNQYYLGEFCYLLPVEKCPVDFRTSAFRTWTPDTIIKPLKRNK